MFKTLALVFAVVFLVPAFSFAAFPLAVLPGVALVFESGAMAASYATAATLVGSVIFGLTFSDPLNNPSSSSTPIYARLSPSAEIPVPDGWSPAAVPGGDPIPPDIDPIPAYNPGVVNAYPCITGPTTPPPFTSSCGSSMTYSQCVNWIGPSNSSDYHRWCYIPSLGVGVNLDGDFPEFFDDFGVDKVAANSTCPGGGAPVDGSCVNADQPFPPDGLLVVNAFNGSATVHPRDTADAVASGFAVGQDGGFTYLGNGMSGTFTPRPDGSVELRTEVVQSNGKTEVTQYDLVPNGTGGYKLGGGSQTYVSGFGSGSVPTGDGSSGDGGNRACGGPSQPACEIDDSGFGSADAGSGLLDAVDAMDERMSALSDFAESDIGVGWDWLPSLMPGAQLECTALLFEPSITHGPAAGLGGSYELDICDKLVTVREIISWLFGLFTVFYVWRKFANSGGAS